MFRRFTMVWCWLFGGDDYFDYYGRDGFSIDVGVSLARSNARIWGTFRSEDHRPLPRTTCYDLLGRPPQRENWAIEPGYLQSLSANLTVGRRGFFAGVEGNRARSIGAEFSLPESDYGFQRYWVDASWRQATLGRSAPASGCVGPAPAGRLRQHEYAITAGIHGRNPGGQLCAVRLFALRGRPSV